MLYDIYSASSNIYFPHRTSINRAFALLIGQEVRRIAIVDLASLPASDATIAARTPLARRGGRDARSVKLGLLI